MIRRNNTVGTTAAATHWQTITQIAHASLSHQLATDWQTLDGKPLLLDGSILGEPSSSVANAVREEWLQTVFHHDDGWRDWDTSPAIDPEHGRPYGFTEMPPAEAQAIWSRSVEACREIGPLAGWLAASHFIELQSPRDDDFVEWSAWLEEQDQKRSEWLRDWMAVNSGHTKRIAALCLFYLRTFDWISLWICCRAAAASCTAAADAEMLDLHSDEFDFGPYRMTPNAGDGPKECEEAGAQLVVDPWPFNDRNKKLSTPAMRIPIGHYQQTEELLAKGEPDQVSWVLTPNRY